MFLCRGKELGEKRGLVGLAVVGLLRGNRPNESKQASKQAQE